MNHNYVIEWDDILLKPLSENELELLRQWRNKDENRKCFINSDIISKEQQKAWFKKYLDKANDYMFIIGLKGTNNIPIGAVALYDVDVENKKAEFGRLLIGDESARGKSIGYKATKAICHFGISKLGLTNIYLSVLIDNTPAVNTYKKAGFAIVKEYQLDNGVFYFMNLGKELV